ncbi:hypothetical protein [Arsukibacterium sp.]|uniref:hypothetical protein n=1 Tax=Arsukibacterium sp. TaxID=1977258 RepID=UPI002FD9CF34
MANAKMLLALLWVILPPSQAEIRTLAFDNPGIAISGEEQQRLIQRVAAIDGANIRLSESADLSTADLLLTTSSVVAGWQLSQITVGYVPTLIALSLQDYDRQSSLKIGQFPRDYRLDDLTIHQIPLDSNVLSLLQANRYDVIVDSSTGVVQHDLKSQLHRYNLYPGRHIRLATKTSALQAKLERKARSVEVKGIKLINQAVTPINIQLIAKSFDREKYLLQESSEDLALFSLLQQHFPEFGLNAVVTSSSDAATKLQGAIPSCIVNYRKRASQTSILYSLPTQVYLGPRLYIDKNNPLLEALTALADSERVLSFPGIAAHIPTMRLATLETLRDDIGLVQNAAQSPHHFLRLLRFDTAVSFLQRGRADALWLYPVMFRFNLQNAAEADNFNSYVLQETSDTVPVFLTCNKTPETIELVQRFNVLLQDPGFQSALLRQNSVGLNQADQQDYAAQYLQALQHAVADNNSINTKQ